VASLADLWNGNDNVGLVVGATSPDELEELREQVPDLPFLVPGVGAQGGDVEAAATHATAGGAGLVNSSRGIIFAGEETEARTTAGDRAAADDDEQYFRAAGQAAKRLKQQLNQYR
jgi:orotidine-5'-phosphate decarboxylase